MAGPKVPPATAGGTQLPITPPQVEANATGRVNPGLGGEVTGRVNQPADGGGVTTIQQELPEKIPNGNAYGWWRNHGLGEPERHHKDLPNANPKNEVQVQPELPNKDLPNQNPKNPGPVPPEVPIRDLPILTPRYQVPESEARPDTAAERIDERERRWNENHNANRANLRRGIIRDYLQQTLQNNLLELKTAINARSGLEQLAKTVGEQLSRTSNDPLMVTDRVLKTIEKEITNLLRVDSTQNFGRPVNVPYDRALQVADLVFRHFPPDFSKQLKDVTPQRLLEGMILLHLWAAPGGNLTDVQRISNCRPGILPEGMAWSSFRETGLLVASLFRNAGTLSDRAGLDVAVQRFVKLLIAKNELGVLLAAVRLTSEAMSGRLPLSRVAALVQVYELIGQLVRNAERAMKEAAESSLPKSVEVMKTEHGLSFSGAVETSEAESALRQYLAFNPSANADSGAAAFFSSQLAETSSRLAVDSSQKELLEWINSGRHRFVTEADLGRPLGVVIDKASEECFTASQIRVVLVRDASVLGWHILKSSLVR